MPKLLLFCPWMLTAALAAQQGSALDLPRLAKLGPMPATAKVVQVGADAVVRDGANRPIDLAELVLAVAGPSAPVLLRVDRLAPSAIVGSVLEVCGEWGPGTVQFAAAAARRPAGAFTLALPEANDVAAPCSTCACTGAARRAAGCARLFLVSMQQRPGRRRSRAVGARRRGARRCAVRTVAAGARRIADAGIDRAVVRTLSPTGAKATCTPTERAALAAAAHTAAQQPLAIDIAPTPFLLVPERSTPDAHTSLSDAAVGCTMRAPPPADAAYWPTCLVARRNPHLPGGEAWPRAQAAGMTWLSDQQAADGGFGDHGPALADTALALLALLGDGSNLDSGSAKDIVRRGAGWLLAHQRDDGSFDADDAGATSTQAMAVLALLECCGLSKDRGMLLRPSARSAAAWMLAQRRPDGGLGDRGKATDTVSTAWGVCALESAALLRPAAERRARSAGRVVRPRRQSIDRAAPLARRLGGWRPGDGPDRDGSGAVRALLRWPAAGRCAGHARGRRVAAGAGRSSRRSDSRTGPAWRCTRVAIGNGKLGRRSCGEPSAACRSSWERCAVRGIHRPAPRASPPRRCG